MTQEVKKFAVNEMATDLAVALMGSLLIALAAQISLTFPFISPVPFAIQPIAVLLLSTQIGRRRAFLSIGFYLLEGCCGYPVFTHGRSGIAHLMGVSGGYLLSYLPVSYWLGGFFEKPRSLFMQFAAMIASTLFILYCGGIWLIALVGPEAAWRLGIAPFFVADILKAVVATGLLSLQHNSRERKNKE